ncbi:uncharacterized protein [Porites lutea]|uniref:uncharacterized protein n=1 Tax=Porites lutea TaxID=51062 RepID=UPI003CC56ADE
MVAKKPVCRASLPIATIERESYTQTLSSVTIQNLDFNGIRGIEPGSFASSKPLYLLNLDGNYLTRINNTTFSGLIYLHQLHLQNNGIQEIAIDSFKGMKHLMYLFLHGNRLSKVLKGIFDPLIKCKFLTLNNNNISEIEPHAFQGLKTIETM